MKKYIILAILALVPFGFASAATDYFLEIDGVKGETSSVSATAEIAPTAISGSSVVSLSTRGTVGSAFVLDGTKSQDDGVVRKYSWKQVSGPTLRIPDPSALKVSVVPSTAGTYVFELFVTDSSGMSSVAERMEFVVTLATQTSVAPATGGTTKPQEGRTDALLEIDTIKGESTETKKGNVEYEWKVEEGESARAPGVEPDEIDYDDDGQPITPDFSILLGGGIDQDDDGDNVPTKEDGLENARKILEDNAKASDQAIESVSLNFEKVTTRVKEDVKIFGFIPATVTAVVEIDAEEQVKVRFPWWTVFASGKDSEALGERIFKNLSNVLKTKHDSIKNSIGNIR